MLGRFATAPDNRLAQAEPERFFVCSTHQLAARRKHRGTHDVMVQYAHNSTTSSVSASTTTTSSSLAAIDVDPLIGVIVVLSLVVLGAIFFVICGLFLKAEAHVHSAGRNLMTEEGLLVEPTDNQQHWGLNLTECAPTIYTS